MLGCGPGPIFTPVEVHNILANGREALKEGTHDGSWVVQQHFDPNGGIVASARERLARIEVILVKGDVGICATKPSGVFQLVRAKIQSGNARLGERSGKPFGDA